jgi:Tfp pilus assembly protein PilF
MKTAPLFCLCLALLLAGCSSGGRLDVRPVTALSGVPIAPAPADPYARGKDHLRAGELGLAMEQFRLALARGGRTVEVLNALAITYDELGRFDLSRSYYEEALARDPGSMPTLNNFGRSLLRQGMLEPAVALLERARTIGDVGGDATVAMNLVAAQRELTESQARRHHAPRALPVAARASGIEVTALNTRTLHTRGRAYNLLGGKTAWNRDAVDAHSGGAPTAPRSTAPGRMDLQIANGTGRRHMAARFGAYLRRQGFDSPRLLNADRYDYRRTRITFREGFERDARELAALLPVPAILEESRRISGDVRVYLGADLLDFDATLLLGTWAG